jgi:hypothetical protein
MMRDAALCLTAAILNCLGLVLASVSQSGTESIILSPNISVAGRFFNAPDVQNGKQRVVDQLALYTTTASSTTLNMQLRAKRDKDLEDILEWIWPRNQSYSNPLRDDLVEGAAEWFLRSPEYTNWVSDSRFYKGPSTLICPGARTSKSHLIR